MQSNLKMFKKLLVMMKKNMIEFVGIVIAVKEVYNLENKDLIAKNVLIMCYVKLVNLLKYINITE